MNCGLCGKKIGLLENQYSEFTDDTGVCLQCHNLLQSTVKPQIDKMINEQQSSGDIINTITSKYATSIEGKEYLENYVNYILMEVREKFIVAENQERFAEIQKKAMTQKITSGYSFEGYRIMDYVGVISGETVIGTGLLSEFTASFDDAFGMESNSFASKMRKVKENALTKLKMQSAFVGGNAVIGVDFDYLTFSNNMIGVSANGTAVVIEKIEE